MKRLLRKREAKTLRFSWSSGKAAMKRSAQCYFSVCRRHASRGEALLHFSCAAGALHSPTKNTFCQKTKGVFCWRDI